MNQEALKYTGNEELEVLKIAQNYNKSLCEKIENIFSRDKTTIDFGAGIGTFSTSLKNNGFKNITCIELDDVQRKEIIRIGFPAYKTISEVLSGNISQIYSLNVLEHIENDQEALNSLFNSMNEEGLIYVYLPAFNILYSAFDKKIGHYRRYTKKEIIRKMNKAGFEIQFAKYSDSIGFFAALAYRFIDKSGTINIKSVSIYDKYIYPLSQIMDNLFSPFFGKNVEILAIKPKHTNKATDTSR